VAQRFSAAITDLISLVILSGVRATRSEWLGEVEGSLPFLAMRAFRIQELT
jgi:hypothetical protein